MQTNPNIILSGNQMAQPRLPDVNAMMQTRTAGMENIYAIEQQRAAQAQAAQKEQEAAAAEAMLPSVLAAYSDASDIGLDRATSLMPAEVRDTFAPFITRLKGIPDTATRKAILEAELAKDEAGRAVLGRIPTEIQRINADIQRGQLDLSRANAARDAAAVGVPKPMSEYEAERIKLDREKAEREAAMAGPGGVKLGPGERATPEGTVELIPGTKAYNTAAKAHASDSKDAAIVVDKIKAAKDKLKYILSEKNKDGFEYNFGGYYAAYVGQNTPTEAAQNMYAKLESLKADLKAAGLEQLRAGGSIGQITEAEWPIIEKQMDSITPYMGEQAARNALVNIQRRLDNIAERATEAYDMQWGDTQFYSPVKAKDTGDGDGDGGDVGGGGIRDGATATNPQTGERIIYRNGKWQPL